MSKEKRLPPAQPRQTAEERRRLMELHRDHDEREHGVRPEVILDMTGDNADWIHNPEFWRKPAGE